MTFASRQDGASRNHIKEKPYRIAEQFIRAGVGLEHRRPHTGGEMDRRPDRQQWEEGLSPAMRSLEEFAEDSRGRIRDFALLYTFRNGTVRRMADDLMVALLRIEAAIQKGERWTRE